MSTPIVHAPYRPATPSHQTWGTWRTVLVVLGALAAITGFGLLLAGAAVGAVALDRDGEGYVTSAPGRLSTDAYALTVREIGVNVSGPDVPVARDMLGQVRIEATSVRTGPPIFVGIGPRDDVDRYLAGVGSAEVRDLDIDPMDVTYVTHPGGAPATPPAEQSFWTVSDAGTGTRVLSWDVAPGDWAVVIMNADGSPAVDADIGVGATLPVLRLVALGLLLTGGSLLVTGGVLVAIPIGTRATSATRTTSAGTVTAGPARP